ncbi:MAG: flippase-like domain-containing protein [Nocardioidaceae bacterium]|nr:flippase-like domain-containing protein [Nocardioidaceae bacterium]
MGISAPGRWAPILGSVVVTGLGIGLVASLPRFVGASWAAIDASLVSVPAGALAGLVLLWFAGLLAHAPVLTAAMRGLTVRQALVLNLSGSAVSNVLPFGGPAGMGLGYAMARSWGFRADRFASYTVSTNLWNALGKFVMGVAVLGVAATLDSRLPSGVGAALAGASAFMAVTAAVTVGTFRTERSTATVGRLLDSASRRVRPASAPNAPSTWLLHSRRELLGAIRSGWRRMSLGVASYLVLQGALLFACLAAVDAGAPVSVVAIAFAIERLISLAPITPGAAGVAELGTVAALHTFGVDPVSATAGVLLYRILMFAVEIPVGGALALTWLHRSRRTAPVVAEPPARVPELVA